MSRHIEYSDITSNSGTRSTVIVATSVMLSFISFWRAAAIVLNDLASTAYYIGGITEEAIGKSAPWFVLGVMLFSYAVRAVYIESCTMFTRGGVYRVVKEAMGGRIAKLAVSALIFDYILTGPISVVSAGTYLVGLINSTIRLFRGTVQLPTNVTVIAVSIAVVIYYWRLNIIGIHESSTRALRIMQLTGVMGILIITWSIVTLVVHPASLPPLPLPSNLHFHISQSTGFHPLGWLEGTSLPSIGIIGVLIAFGHSVLAMSGEESLAQVSREIEAPKLKNLKRAGQVIFVFSLVFTSLISFFAVMIIPDDIRPQYTGNLISGLAMNLIGPLWLRQLLQAFVVVVGFLLLAGAVNTAIIGSNGVLNRISEDGVLTSWFRAPHQKYGTSYRLIHLVAVLQILTIILSRGNVILLGEAYAFGVIWSFTFMAASVVILRFKQPSPREWRVPFNLRIGKKEFPVGLTAVAFTLLSLALTNLLTKEAATISGGIFTGILYAFFSWSERRVGRQKESGAELDQFNLVINPDVTRELVKVRPGGILIAARDYKNLQHLRQSLSEINTDEQDVTVMTIRELNRQDTAETDRDQDKLFTDYEQLLFTRVVAVAEKLGKKVHLLVLTSNEVFQAIVRTAIELECSTIVVGESAKMVAKDQSRLIGEAWESSVHPGKRKLRVLKLIGERQRELIYELGAHRPNITPDDIELTHQIWLDLSTQLNEIHHNEVISIALKRLQIDLKGYSRETIITSLKDHKTSCS